MEKKTQKLKKLLSLLLAASMTMSLLSVTAFATEGEEEVTDPYASIKQEYADAQAAVEAVKEKQAEPQAIVDAYEKNLADLRDSTGLSAAETALADAEAKLETLKTEKADLEDEIKDLKAKIEDLKSEEAADETGGTDNSAEIKELEGKIAEKETAVTAKTGEITAQEAVVSEATSAKTAAQTAYDSAVTVIPEEETNAYNEAVKDLETLAAELKTAEANEANLKNTMTYTIYKFEPVTISTNVGNLPAFSASTSVKGYNLFDAPVNSIVKVSKANWSYNDGYGIDSPAGTYTATATKYTKSTTSTAKKYTIAENIEMPKCEITVYDYKISLSYNGSNLSSSQKSLTTTLAFNEGKYDNGILVYVGAETKASLLNGSLGIKLPSYVDSNGDTLYAPFVDEATGMSYVKLKNSFWHQAYNGVDYTFAGWSTNAPTKEDGIKNAAYLCTDAEAAAKKVAYAQFDAASQKATADSIMNEETYAANNGKTVYLYGVWYIAPDISNQGTYDYVSGESKWNADKVTLGNSTDGLKYEADLEERVITVTIPSTVTASTITVNPTLAVLAALNTETGATKIEITDETTIDDVYLSIPRTGYLPGEARDFTLRIVNESGAAYTYTDGSAVVGTYTEEDAASAFTGFDGAKIPADWTVDRIANPLIVASVPECVKSSKVDNAKLDTLMEAKTYANAQEQLNRLFLDAYNKANGTEHTKLEQISDHDLGQLVFGSKEPDLSNDETNIEIAETGYNYFYNFLCTLDGESIGSYMHDGSTALSSLDQKYAGAIATVANNGTGIVKSVLTLDGITDNAYQDMNFAFGMSFQMTRAADTTPTDPTDPPSEPHDRPSRPTTPNNPTVVIPDPQTPTTDIPATDVPTTDTPATEIPDGPAPLAEAPKTGDVSALWLALTALSGSGLAGVTFLGRKRKDDAQ